LLHENGIPLRFLGKICTNSFFNHTREIAVIDIISRAAKLLFKDGLYILSEKEKLSSLNIKKCFQHFL
jgi:hypothetical protein